jgi:homoserine O-succinyltransferase/O-acetyltransferase
LSTLASVTPKRAAQRAADAPLVIGLVNNMPDAALRTTERQFGDLISAGNRPVTLRLFALPDVPRSEAGCAHIKEHYEEIDALYADGVDALIVTGTQPRSPNLTDEPYWASLAKLIDWAGENTVSTVWSCLAAHAAVLHLDGIKRQSFAEKLSGVFDCTKTAQHPLTAGVSALWPVPHSRYNDVPREPLVKAGYRILSQSHTAGVDTFVRQDKSLFVLFQGHPEYDAGALQREYRADVARFLSGERQTYPNAPRHYFDDSLLAELDLFRARAEADRTVELMTSLPIDKADVNLTQSWRSPAHRIYANWLSYVAERADRAALAADRT